MYIFFWSGWIKSDEKSYEYLDNLDLSTQKWWTFFAIDLQYFICNK